ncbi:MAG: hypothetical protein HY243_06480 [Proteobacteria bacterium]|nr:hypothetical protein [Pseudomonadota bacterium]
MTLRIRSTAVAALLAALALAGCSKTDAGGKSTPAKSPQATALSGYSHDVTDDVFGYYMPDKDYRAGKFVFRNISLGGLEDFTTYEEGKTAEKNFAPFLLEFDDTTSKQATNELGGIYYKNAPRVLPIAYKVTKTTLAFAGTDKQLGAVTFTGTLDLRALKAAQNGNDKQVVATGDLTFAGKTFKNVRFTWFGGD